MMENPMQQWLMFQKKALDNSFQSMAQLQDFMTEQLLSCTRMNPVLPDEGKKLIEEWAEAYRKGRDDLKARVNESYQKAESFFTNGTGKKNPPKT